MYIITLIKGDFMYKNFALFYFQSDLFKPYQILTYMFMHGGFAHLFFNMFTLYCFGSVLEEIWGGKKFLLFYLFTGIGAALCNEAVMYLQLQGDPALLAMICMAPTVGASGAIYGLLLAYGMMFPDNRMMLVFPPISLKAKWMILVFFIIEFLCGVTGAFSTIAHFAHLGGMLFGLFLILIWKHKGRLYSE
ncbi:MAG: rhomboid family intramembrane serine protease [Bacteroidales bacterium]|nr:rhomboid family intramembrane serine protease [Bacteroidales bacterium]